ncbi:MAG TPA: ABC transporter substrate-binding protein [Methylomirabilota bacterium]|jgi:ABC-type nitrate/sulfonate/bicarbonate transport system substrate-binding protein|nr:ABC transporter substrate-binding protein [Methylomirabilota bacterium]
MTSRRAGVLLLLLVAVLAVACATERAGSQPPLRKVKVLIDWKAGPTYAGFYLAKERGFYSRRGLDVEIVEGTGATVSAQVIGAGAPYFIGSSSAEATAIARSKGLPVRSVAVFYPSVPTVVYSRADTPIRSPQDLRGKRIGLMKGSITYDEFRGLLAANRIDRSMITEVETGFGAAPLLTRQVDGLVDYQELTPTELKTAGHDIVIMRLADFGLKAYSLNLIVNDAAMPREEAAVRAITEATIEGYELLRRNPAEAAAIFSRILPAGKKDYVLESMKIVARLVGDPVGRQTRSGWEQTIATLEGLGLLARDVTVDEVTARDYVAAP